MAGADGGNFLSNVLSGAVNSWISGAINTHNQKDLMDYQYDKQRQFTEDQYSLMAKGMYRAGINPALAMGGASPAQLSAAGSASSSSAGGVGSIGPQDKQADTQQMLAEGQLDVMSAQRDKIEAETNAIVSKTPGEVDKLANENTKLKSDVALNNALMQNHEVWRRLTEKNIDLTTAKIVTEGTKQGLNRAQAGLAGANVGLARAQTGKVYLEAQGIKIDLSYAKDINDVYSTITHTLAEKTGLDASNFGAVAQILGKGLKLGAKLFGIKSAAKSITQNSEHIHYHTYKGDKYNVNGSIYRGK